MPSFCTLCLWFGYVLLVAQHPHCPSEDPSPDMRDSVPTVVTNQWASGTPAGGLVLDTPGCVNFRPAKGLYPNSRAWIKYLLALLVNVRGEQYRLRVN